MKIEEKDTTFDFGLDLSIDKHKPKFIS